LGFVGEATLMEPCPARPGSVIPPAPNLPQVAATAGLADSDCRRTLASPATHRGCERPVRPALPLRGNLSCFRKPNMPLALLDLADQSAAPPRFSVHPCPEDSNTSQSGSQYGRCSLQGAATPPTEQVSHCSFLQLRGGCPPAGGRQTRSSRKRRLRLTRLSKAQKGKNMQERSSCDLIQSIDSTSCRAGNPPLLHLGGSGTSLGPRYWL
jgi:hypothetical protein